MSTTKKPIDGGAAFPEVRVRDGDNYNPPTKVYYRGMTLRDWFAGMALQGMIAHVDTSPKTSRSGREILAENAFKLADAMIEARKGGSHE